MVAAAAAAAAAMETAGSGAGGTAIAPPRLAPVSGVLSQVTQSIFYKRYFTSLLTAQRDTILYVLYKLSGREKRERCMHV